MHGAPLLYNLMLAEQAQLKDGVAKYLQSLAQWAGTLSKRARVLAQWNRVRFWDIVRSVNPRISFLIRPRPWGTNMDEDDTGTN